MKLNSSISSFFFFAFVTLFVINNSNKAEGKTLEEKQLQQDIVQIQKNNNNPINNNNNNVNSDYFTSSIVLSNFKKDTCDLYEKFPDLATLYILDSSITDTKQREKFEMYGSEVNMLTNALCELLSKQYSSKRAYDILKNTEFEKCFNDEYCLLNNIHIGYEKMKANMDTYHAILIDTSTYNETDSKSSSNNNNNDKEEELSYPFVQSFLAPVSMLSGSVTMGNPYAVNNARKILSRQPQILRPIVTNQVPVSMSSKSFSNNDNNDKSSNKEKKDIEMKFSMGITTPSSSKQNNNVMYGGAFNPNVQGGLLFGGNSNMNSMKDQFDNNMINAFKPLFDALESGFGDILNKGTGLGMKDANSNNGDDKVSLFDFTVKDYKGKDVQLSTYKGKKKAFIVTNVASQWGLTPQNYKEFEQLYSKYSAQGLEILAFPCNQFGGQEPGSNEEIQKFAKDRGAKYPVFAKIDVNGNNAIPLYKWMKSETVKFGPLADIKWNFAKFLIDENGNIVKRYAPPESPLSMENDVKKVLGL